MKILILLIFLAIGLSMVIKTALWERTTGPIGWAERTFGGAGTNTFYKLLGVLLIIIGLSYATGLVDAVLGGFIRSIFGSNQPAAR